MGGDVRRRRRDVPPWLRWARVATPMMTVTKESSLSFRCQAGHFCQGLSFQAAAAQPLMVLGSSPSSTPRWVSVAASGICSC